MFRTIMLFTLNDNNEIVELVNAVRRACDDCPTVMNYEVGFDPDAEGGAPSASLIIDFETQADAANWPFSKQYLNMKFEMPAAVIDTFTYKRS